ncbi:MAG: hypothetical protein QOE27_951 [Solirubrobacteraceae bacterium]|nr:hypothetical protein [Solirubrobacteraceae bacterium]MEA2356048.1 hypothetical protein [Solirubrobacteraceae bacterium]
MTHEDPTNGQVSPPAAKAPPADADTSRAMRVAHLRALVDEDRYAVDPAAVAAALIARPAAWRLLGLPSRGDARSRPARAARPRPPGAPRRGGPGGPGRPS